MADTVPVRLGGIAANLARVRSFSRNIENKDAVYDLFEESKHFIEWTASETEPATAASLVELQVQIAVWQRGWLSNWADETKRNSIALASSEWSTRVLESSGLLSQ